MHVAPCWLSADTRPPVQPPTWWGWAGAQPSEILSLTWGALLNIVDVEGVLAAQPEPLEPPRLAALQANDTLYRLLALQPEGRIRITEQGIGNVDARKAHLQMSSFLALAGRPGQQPDVVITPEYSVPWSALIEALERGVCPDLGKLWVLGCESLPLGETALVRARLAGRVVVIDDDSSPDVRTTQCYRNPLAYVFQTRTTADGAARVVLLIQYKTAPSGDPGNTEARGMLPGSSVYVFGRKPGEVRLMTLICSDVFGLSDAQLRDHYDGLLLLHIQLNNNPRHAVYMPYRKRLFSFQGRTELICLNWAEKIKVQDESGVVQQDWRNIGGSAWYLLPRGFDTSDARISANHAHGLYYTRYESVRVHALQFHYGPQAFEIEATKVFHYGVPGPRSNLSGPRALGTLRWSAEEGSWTAPNPPGESPDDGFGALLARVGAGVNLQDIGDVYASGPVAAERVLAITAGEFGPGKNWHDPANVDSMKLCPEEIVRRMTFTQDSSGDQFRSARLGAARAVANLRSTGYSWPGEVAFLRSGFQMRWSQDFPNRNVEALDGSRKLATVIYAGQLGDPTQIERLEQRARQTLAGPVPEPMHALSDDEWREHRRQHYAQPLRLCVLVSDGVSVSPFRSATAASIAIPAGTPAVDITSPAPKQPTNERGSLAE